MRERMRRTAGRQIGAALLLLAAIAVTRGFAQTPDARQPELVWIDTDIGDDIDDAFALGLILRSPELRVLGISTAFGDTEARARIVDRFLASTSEQAIPVTAGVHTETDNVMTQRAYGERFPAHEHPDGVAAMLAEIKRHPGQITLIAIGPLFNIGAAIDKEPETFRLLKRVVMMGGSVERGYGLAANGSPKACGAGVEYRPRSQRRGQALCGWRADLHDAAGFDANPAGGSGARVNVWHRQCAYRSTDAALSPVDGAYAQSFADADVVRSGGGGVYLSS